jgi:putative spermidine/putrescine transport system permease protein
MALGRIKFAGLPRRVGWEIWLLPSLIVLGCVFFLPILQLFVLSFHAMSGPAEVGATYTLRNFRSFLSDPFFGGILLRTVALGAAVVAACLLLGYPVSYFLARTRSRFRGLLLFLVIAPLLISSVVRNIGWYPILGESGLVNWILMRVGLLHQPIILIGNYTGVAIGLTHALLPFMVLILMTVIQRIDPEIEQAATNLGAGELTTFFHVTLPLSLPGTLAGSLLVFTMAISAYTTPVILGGGKVLVMATYIAEQFRTVLDYGMGACAAAILMIVAVGVTLFAVRLQAGRRS